MSKIIAVVHDPIKVPSGKGINGGRGVEDDRGAVDDGPAILCVAMASHAVAHGEETMRAVLSPPGRCHSPLAVMHGVTIGAEARHLGVGLCREEPPNG